MNHHASPIFGCQKIFQRGLISQPHDTRDRPRNEIYTRNTISDIKGGPYQDYLAHFEHTELLLRKNVPWLLNPCHP